MKQHPRRRSKRRTPTPTLHDLLRQPDVRVGGSVPKRSGAAPARSQNGYCAAPAFWRASACFLCCCTGWAAFCGA